MSEELALLPEYASAHLRLTLLALSLGIAISVPTGIWISGRRRLESVVLGAASVLQTVPSLALLAFMVPVLAALGAISSAYLGVAPSSIGFLPALLALTLYSVLPVLRNTVTGLAGVDAALIEAARGVGMTPRQRLLRVQLPLALPMIVAGVRTSTVWVVGTATLATPVGATSLGNFIFSGLQTRNTTAVVVGSVAAAGLALLLDGLIRGLEVGLRLRSRTMVGGVCAALLLMGFASVADLGLFDARSAPRSIAVGAKTFTEQYVLSALLRQRIESATDLRTRAVDSLGSTIAFDALKADELDLYVDYSGTIWATIMKREDRPPGRAEVVDEVARYLQREHGIVVLGSLGFENTYALGMRADDAEQRGIATISQLAQHAGDLEIGGDYEFFSRPEWKALERQYGLAFRKRRSMDSALMYGAVQQGEVDVISAFSTDGRIAAFDLRLLRDDRGVIPPYDAVLLASPRLAAENPTVLESVRALVGRIDDSTMQRMNWEVDGKGRSPAAVAADFLAELGLAATDAPRASR